MPPVQEHGARGCARSRPRLGWRSCCWFRLNTIAPLCFPLCFCPRGERPEHPARCAAILHALPPWERADPTGIGPSDCAEHFAYVPGKCLFTTSLVTQSTAVTLIGRASEARPLSPSDPPELEWRILEGIKATKFFQHRLRIGRGQLQGVVDTILEQVPGAVATKT